MNEKVIWKKNGWEIKIEKEIVEKVRKKIKKIKNTKIDSENFEKERSKKKNMPINGFWHMKLRSRKQKYEKEGKNEWKSIYKSNQKHQKNQNREGKK